MTARQAMTFNRGSQLELMACSHTDRSLMLSISDGEDSLFLHVLPRGRERRYNGHIKIAALCVHLHFLFFANMAQRVVSLPDKNRDPAIWSVSSLVFQYLTGIVVRV